MGVKLNDFIASAKKVITLENLTGKIVVIDAFNVLYQFLASIRMNGELLHDRQGHITSHLSGLLSRTTSLMDAGIKVAFVFDGKPNPLKSDETERRNLVKAEATKKMEAAREAGNIADVKKYSQATSKLTHEMVAESKQLLGFLGIPVIDAIEDGEAQAACMIQKNLAWGVGSQDYDTFLFGGSRVIRNLSVNKERKVYGKTIVNNIEYYNLAQVLEKMKITREQLVDMAILMGVDFFPGIDGIQSKTAYKLINQFGDLQTLVKNTDLREKYDFTALNDGFIDTLRTIFLKPKYNPDFTLTWSKPNADKITDFLVHGRDFNEERVKSALSKISEVGKRRQVVLDRFVTPKK